MEDSCESLSGRLPARPSRAGKASLILSLVFGGLSVLLILVGLSLGIVGVTRPDDKSGLAVSGVVLNSLVLLGGVGFLICCGLYGL